MTPQREVIMDAICEAEGHTTLAEILTRVEAKAPAINQATVYRTLHILHETGLVAKTEITPGEVVYELAGQSPHHHLLCRHCHHEIEIDAEPLMMLQREIQKKHDFAIDANHLVLTGLCAYCRQDP